MCRRRSLILAPACNSQVGKLGSIVDIQDVLRFHIAMDNAVPVQVPDSIDDGKKLGNDASVSTGIVSSDLAVAAGPDLLL